MEIEKTEVESSVSAVTVYPGRAMVTRTARVSLGKGNQLLVFPDLSADIEAESIQVSGKGNAVLGDCSFETEYFSEDSSERRTSLLKQQESLSDSMAEEQLIIEACNRDSVFLEKVSTFVTTPVKAGTSSPVQPVSDPGSWESMLQFYQQKHADAAERKLTAERKIRELTRELETVESRLAALGGSGSRTRNVIKVNLLAEAEGEVEVDLSYLLYGPNWVPVYNLRGGSGDEEILLEYDALVSQSSGEDWQGVELKLSTAKVNVSGLVPELSPWRISTSSPRISHYRVKKSRSMDDDEMYNAAEPAAPMMMDASFEEIRTEEAAVESGGASVVFSVPGGSSIGGDGDDNRVVIMRRKLPATFRYTTVPKLAEYAYLTADMTNDSDFPLLPGRMNIFFDGSFVSSSQMPLVMPGEETAISLGVDEGVQVEYRFLKRFRRNEGMLDKRTSEQFDYQIKISNKKKQQVSLKVYDQFPISQEKEVSVKPLSPVIKQNSSELSINDESRVEWVFTLEPGGVREIPFSFAVEYPRDQAIWGL